MLPNFIGIGAPKAGTTWIFNCLKEHPQIFVAEVKETKFFDEGVIENRINEYEKHFIGSEGYKAIGEISTRYLASKYGAPERIKKHVPDVRLFVSVRNPIEQVYSYYWHLYRQNFHKGTLNDLPNTFEEALNNYENEIIHNAYYYKHLGNWLKFFDSSQIFIIFYDDIKDNPRGVLKDLFTYLGVDNEFEPKSLNTKGSSVRKGTSPKNILIQRIYPLLYQNLNRILYFPLKKLIGSWNAEKIKNKLRVRQTLEYVFMNNGYPEMNYETRIYLRSKFKEDISSLSLLTGRDLSSWE